MDGKIIKMDNGEFGFETIDFDYSKPQRYRQVWPVIRVRTSGMSYCRVDDAIGKAAQCRDGRVHCYLGQGNSMDGDLPQGGATLNIVCEVTDVPIPKVRKGIETRWRYGKWEKLLRTGWTAA